ncbi:hypothetical protein PQR75_43640 [Paraburkholderia fungorum]|uniref:hypothetical protein n=1 Tax=Paraburkholderia TaxID=1822464 RepID=UPI0038BC3903
MPGSQERETIVNEFLSDVLTYFADTIDEADDLGAAGDSAASDRDFPRRPTVRHGGRAMLLAHRASSRQGNDHALPICAPYREFNIDIQATTGKSLCFHPPGHRYEVSWTISSFGQSAQALASFPEQLEFLTENEAFRYAEDRAHTLIDGMLTANPSIYSEGQTTYAPERRERPEA